MSSATYPFCEICPIIENPSPAELERRIYEGDAWRVTLREDQALLGRSFITLKEHRQSLARLSLDQEIEFRDIRNRLYTALDAAFSSDVINIDCLMNLAFKSNGDPNFAPQPHVHRHVKPRYSSPRQVGGEIFEDPEFGAYLRAIRTQKVTPELGKIITGRIKPYF